MTTTRRCFVLLLLGPLVCHRDTVPDNDQGCCYFSCSNWDWYEAKEIKAAHGMLYTAFALGIIMIVIAIVVLVKVPSELVPLLVFAF